MQDAEPDAHVAREVQNVAHEERDLRDHESRAAHIHAALKEEMDIPSKLLEHACGRIVKRLFRDFPKISEIEIKLSKRNPPMGADIDSAGVEMHCTRD